MDNKDIAHEWFSVGEVDLNSAKFLLSMEPTPIEVVCYHCQQSAEKYLKGFIALNGGEILKTHDLLILNKKCCEYNKAFVEIRNDCIELVDYGVQARYPFYVDVEKHDMELAIKSADRIKKFVIRKSI